MPLTPEPTNEDIDKYHQLYIDQLTGIFNKYKKIYNIDRELEIY